MPDVPSATRSSPDAAALAEGLRRGERRALARAITFAESTRPEHRAVARAVLEAVAGEGREALRIGLSGTPGVGKSTFIEAFGSMLLDMGHRVAVLAVDPSSARTGGSILGDKTRMDRLSRDDRAFIRPSPSAGSLGGVARRTREAVRLAEAAGYDVVIVETVGVGQSETMVAEMTDIFALLLAPAGGDELQGVKRGIMEIADLIVVNKADGDLAAAARRTAADYAGALRLLRKRDYDPPEGPAAVTASALAGAGLEEVWRRIGALDLWRRESGWRDRRRALQAVAAMRQELDEGLRAAARAGGGLAALETRVAAGEIAPEAAAQSALDMALGRSAPARGAGLRLAAATVLTPDYDAALAFFVDGLGFDLVEDNPQGGPKRWVRVAPPGGGSALILAQADGAAQIRAIGAQAGGRVAFFLETDDFERDRERITAAGGHFIEAPRDEAYGRVAVFTDPFGGRWDLIRPAPS